MSLKEANKDAKWSYSLKSLFVFWGPRFVRAGCGLTFSPSPTSWTSVDKEKWVQLRLVFLPNASIFLSTSPYNCALQTFCTVSAGIVWPKKTSLSKSECPKWAIHRCLSNISRKVITFYCSKLIKYGGNEVSLSLERINLPICCNCVCQLKNPQQSVNGFKRGILAGVLLSGAQLAVWSRGPCLNGSCLRNRVNG